MTIFTDEAAGMASKPTLLQRLGWLALIWCASVFALGMAALLMRLFMHAIGLQTP